MRGAAAHFNSNNEPNLTQRSLGNLPNDRASNQFDTSSLISNFVQQGNNLNQSNALLNPGFLRMMQQAILDDATSRRNNSSNDRGSPARKRHSYEIHSSDDESSKKKRRSKKKKSKKDKKSRKDKKKKRSKERTIEEATASSATQARTENGNHRITPPHDDEQPSESTSEFAYANLESSKPDYSDEEEEY